jgi:hypothetical protein
MIWSQPGRGKQHHYTILAFLLATVLTNHSLQCFCVLFNRLCEVLKMFLQYQYLDQVGTFQHQTADGISWRYTEYENMCEMLHQGFFL